MLTMDAVLDIASPDPDYPINRVMALPLVRALGDPSLHKFGGLSRALLEREVIKRVDHEELVERHNFTIGGRATTLMVYWICQHLSDAGVVAQRIVHQYPSTHGSHRTRVTMLATEVEDHDGTVLRCPFLTADGKQDVDMTRRWVYTFGKDETKRMLDAINIARKARR